MESCWRVGDHIRREIIKEQRNLGSMARFAEVFPVNCLRATETIDRKTLKLYDLGKCFLTYRVYWTKTTVFIWWRKNAREHTRT